MEVFLTIASIVVIAIVLIILFIRRKNERKERQQKEKLTLERLLEKVKYQLVELVKEDNFFGKSDEEWEALYKRKKRIQNAMRNCVHGIDADKIIVKDLIKQIIQDILPDREAICEVVDFNSSYIDPHIKFEILMHYLKKDHGKKAMPYLINKYNLDDVQYIIEQGQTPSYAVTNEQFENIYREEMGSMPYFEYLDLLDIMSTLLYEQYKGFGVIDTLRDQDIDGYNIGTSGSVISRVVNRDKKVAKAPRSVWIYYRGRYIHLRFLTFGSEEEIRRVVQLHVRYNNPGPLTEKRGYLVNTMFDKSRVLAIRPPASEYWAMFVRKFSLSDASLEFLINPQVKDIDEFGSEYLRPKYKNATIPLQLIKFLMLGQVTTAFTGRQGSGKTTMMAAAIQPIDARLTIRILEMAPELYLRELYPQRNILSVQETQYVTAAELQDALKKSDAALSIVGEVATDIIAARMIQMGQVASVFTIFSHHANRAQDLVQALRNSLMNAGNFNNEKTAEQQVLDVVKVDVHLDYDVEGNRYIERITEIIKLDEGVPYPAYDPKNPVHSMNRIQAEYYRRITDRMSFTTKNILHFDHDTFTYHTDGWFSKTLTRHMMSRIPKEHRKAFKELASNWGDE